MMIKILEANMKKNFLTFRHQSFLNYNMRSINYNGKNINLVELSLRTLFIKSYH